jgi:hypothetical protein
MSIGHPLHCGQTDRLKTGGRSLWVIIPCNVNTNSSRPDPSSPGTTNRQHLGDSLAARAISAIYGMCGSATSQSWGYIYVLQKRWIVDAL